jgi:hypothetical protein
MFKTLTIFILLSLAPTVSTASQEPDLECGIERKFECSTVIVPPEVKKRAKLVYVRRTIPFILSGTAAVTEMVLLVNRSTNSDAVMAATVLWLGANLSGLLNLYLDFRSQ